MAGGGGVGAATPLKSLTAQRRIVSRTQLSGMSTPRDDHPDVRRRSLSALPCSFGDYRLSVEEEGFRLTGEIRIGKFLARVDPVDSLKPFVRTIVKLLNTPIQYRYLAEYEFEFESGGESTRLQGRALMDHMVLRHERKQDNRTENLR